MTTTNLRKLFRRQGELGIWIPLTSSADWLDSLAGMLSELTECPKEPRLFRLTACFTHRDL